MFEKSEGFTLRTFAFCYLDIAFGLYWSGMYT